MKNALRWAAPFKGLISYLHMKQLEDGRCLIKFTADDSSVLFSSTSMGEIDFEEARGCFGNLNYLEQVLNSPFINLDTKMSLNVRERNNKKVLSSVQFHPNNRMEIMYIATDPFRSSLAPPVKMKLDDWPISFALDEPVLKEIEAFKKIHAAAPSTGKEDIVEVCYSDENIILEFGQSSSHTSSLVLEAPVNVSGKTKTMSMHVLTEHFIRALQQAQDSEGMVMAEMSGKALKMMRQDEIGEHELVVVGRRMRED